MHARRLVGVLLAAVAVVVSGCGGSDEAEGTGSTGAVADLTSVDTVRTAFARGDGSPRLLLLLSPT